MGKISIYNLEGVWIPPPPETDWDREWRPKTYFADRSVVTEISELLQDAKFKGPELFHTTGSASLDGIARCGKIMNSETAEKSGEAIKTGEYISEQRISDMVCASLDPIEGYGLRRWFDEFRVTFGLSTKKMEHYLEKYKGTKYELDMGDDGRIGPEVPLELVDVIMGERKHLGELAKWQKTNVPHARILSYEAYKLIMGYDFLLTYEKDLPEGIKRRTNTLQTLLDQKPIVIK